MNVGQFHQCDLFLHITLKSRNINLKINFSFLTTTFLFSYLDRLFGVFSLSYLVGYSLLKCALISNSFSLLVCPWGRGVSTLARSKVPTPQPRYLPPGQVRMGGGVPQGTYPPQPRYLHPQPGQDGVYPKVSIPWPRYLPLPQPFQVGGVGTPRYLLPPAKVPTPLT